MPASTGCPPPYVTAAPSNVNPSTREPSGASASHSSIPALRPRRSAGLALLAGEQVEHVVVEERQAVVRLEDHAERRDGARVPQNAAVERERRLRQVEERREILGARHDVAVAFDVEQKDVVRERSERRRELAAPLGDDAAVEIDEPRRR